MKLLKPVFLMMAMALSMVSMTAYAEDLDDVTVQVLNSDDQNIADVENNMDLPDADQNEAEDHQGQSGSHEDATDDDSSHDSMDDSHEEDHEEMEGEHEDEHEDDDSSATPAT